MKVLFVFGTRPEAIKMAPIVHALSSDEGFQVKVCVTGQHRVMLDQVLRTFSIDPDFDLSVMRPGQKLPSLTSEILLGLGPIFDMTSPELTMVHGDTTTTFAASLASFYAAVPVAHVEAGLRTRDKLSPYPEEINRRLTTVLADVHFAPTIGARDNLLREGISEKSIRVVGNTVVDALLLARRKIQDQGMGAMFRRALVAHCPQLEETFDAAGKNALRRIVLVTGHRRESFGRGFREICMALRDIASQYPDVSVIYPVHLNPNVQAPTSELLSAAENIYLTEPLDYLMFVWLMNLAYLVVTDSGGVQEEAPSFGKPVVVLREVSERPEGISAGIAKLAGGSREGIAQAIAGILDSPELYKDMQAAKNPYGDGMASARIRDELYRFRK